MPPIEIDKILSDPLLIVASVLLLASPILFIIALIKYMRAPRPESFGIPHHELESPVPTPHSLAPIEQPKSAPRFTMEAPSVLKTAKVEPKPPVEPAVEAPTPEPPAPPVAPPAPQRRAESASEKTVVMPPGMAEMQSEMEIALSQLRVMNKRISALEKEVARLRGGSEPAGGAAPPSPV